LPAKKNNRPHFQNRRYIDSYKKPKKSPLNECKVNLETTMSGVVCILTLFSFPPMHGKTSIARGLARLFFFTGPNATRLAVKEND